MTSTEHSRPTSPQDARSTPPLAPIRHARERFLAGGPLPDGIPENVVAGWRRARFFGVRRDLAAARDGVAPVSSPLLVAARPVLERLAPALDAGDCAMVLTDERCRVLWSRGRWSRGTLRHDLSESEVGHNSAAATLRTGVRAEAHGPEHFLDLWQEISAVSVPLRAHGSRRPVGTVTVVSGLCAGCGPHPGAALAEAAAAAVEGRVAAGAPPPAQQLLLDAYLRASDGAAPVVALDGHSRLVGEAAARQLSPEELGALELRAAALLDGGGEGATADGGEAAAADGGEAAAADGDECAARITPVLDPASGAAVGVVAVLRQEPSPRASAPSSSSSSSRRSSRRSSKASPQGSDPALPTGSSVPWRHAVGQARELARTAGPLLLSGERGTGKTALARALLQESGGPEPLAFDAAQAKEGELTLLRTSLTNGEDGGPRTARPVLLRHAERLRQSDVAVLNALIADAPRLRLVVTHTPGTPEGPCLLRLLDGLSARSVVLPPLCERAQDIRELLAHLAPAPAPGHPPLAWTLDAVRALERHSWPGNVTELAHVVRAVAERRRVSGPVRRAELPDAVREKPAARQLSAIERAEHEAITEALRRNGGNKARAAAALGIARATLYRKLRGYG